MPPETTPNLFDSLKLKHELHHLEGDIRDAQIVDWAIKRAKADIVLHLAAQPLVRRSYAEPVATFATNVMGTVNVLEAVRTSDTVQACVVVTSDKCYENREWERGYTELDAMGGYDPYSASKGCSELVTSSYRRSFCKDGRIRIASARAGNVIGGGDWSQDRIVTDFVTTILAERPLTLRNPYATRPWQHVLEPLSGYLHLAAQLWQSKGERFAQAWNFGPADSSVIPVVELAELLCRKWGRGNVVIQVNHAQPHEAGLLKLDSSKAAKELSWKPVWNVEQAVEATVDWYQGVSQGADPIRLTNEQLDHYCEDARNGNLTWCVDETIRSAA